MVVKGELWSGSVNECAQDKESRGHKYGCFDLSVLKSFSTRLIRHLRVTPNSCNEALEKLFKSCLHG